MWIFSVGSRNLLTLVASWCYYNVAGGGPDRGGAGGDLGSGVPAGGQCRNAAGGRRLEKYIHIH